MTPAFSKLMSFFQPFFGLCCLALRAALGGGWTCLVCPLVTLSPGSPESIECDNDPCYNNSIFYFVVAQVFPLYGLYVIVVWYSCEVEKATVTVKAVVVMTFDHQVLQMVLTI